MSIYCNLVIQILELTFPSAAILTVQKASPWPVTAELQVFFLLFCTYLFDIAVVSSDSFLSFFYELEVLNHLLKPVFSFDHRGSSYIFRFANIFFNVGDPCGCFKWDHAVLCKRLLTLFSLHQKKMF